MRKIIFFISLIIGLISCSGNPNPNNDIIGKKTEQTTWVWDSAQNKYVMGEQTYYQIAPTLQQSFWYSNKRQDRWAQLLGSAVLFLLFLSIMLSRILDPTASKTPKFLLNSYIFHGLAFLTISFSLYFYLGYPLGVRWNNDKWVKKEVYEKAIQTTGSTRPIWDSLESNCLIIDGPYGCYK
jgi:hypothetical protein